MCGRYALFSDLERVSRQFHVEGRPAFSFSSRYNIAPTQEIPVVHYNGLRRINLMRWGLVPFWAKDTKIGNRLINARAETVEDKPAFREAFSTRRLIVPADGYYEWRQDNNGKTPYFIRRKDRRLLGLGGLWESWKYAGGVLHTFCIITVPAVGLLAEIHHRMPLIIGDDDLGTWMLTPPEDARRLLRPTTGIDVEAYPVSRAVNDPKNDGPELLEPYPDQ